LGANSVAKPSPRYQIVTDTYFEKSNINILNSVFQSLTLIVFIVTLALGGYKLLFQYSMNYADRWAGVGNLFDLLIIFSMISTVLEFLRLGRKKFDYTKDVLRNTDIIYRVNMLLILGFFLLTGYRSEFLLLLLPIIFLFSNFVHRITAKVLVLSLIFAVFGLAAIKTIRAMPSGLLSIRNLVDYIDYLKNVGGEPRQLLAYLFDDLTSANAANFFFTEYVKTNGITMGKNIVLQLLAVIPFLQSSFMVLFNFTPMPSSSEVFTRSINGVNYTSGLGTHIIGDLYYTFGLPGVVILMFVLGLIVALLENKASGEYKHSIYDLVALCFLIGNSLYATRVEYFFILRLMCLALIILCLVDLFIGMLFPVPHQSYTQC